MSGTLGFRRAGLVAAALLGLGTLTAAPASATPLFFDDFESGNLDKWNPNQYGQIVLDPADPNNHVLSFSSVNSRGDIFTSTPITLETGRAYEISFDFYGERQRRTLQ